VKPDTAPAVGTRSHWVNNESTVCHTAFSRMSRIVDELRKDGDAALRDEPNFGNGGWMGDELRRS
jgi:hypothetical protein